MLLRDSEAPRGFQGRRDGRFTQRVWLPDVAAINLGVLTESVRGTAFGVLMVPAVLPSQPTRGRTQAKAPCHRSDTLDKVAKPRPWAGRMDRHGLVILSLPNGGFMYSERHTVHRNRGRSE